MNDDEQWIMACISVGITVAVFVYKFTPLASMVLFGEAGQIIFFGLFAFAVCLVTMVVAAALHR